MPRGVPRRRGVVYWIVPGGAAIPRVSSGMPCLQTIPDDGLRDTARAFNVPLREEFLDAPGDNG